MKLQKTPDELNKEIRAQVEDEMPRPIGGFETEHKNPNGAICGTSDSWNYAEIIKMDDATQLLKRIESLLHATRRAITKARIREDKAAATRIRDPKSKT